MTPETTRGAPVQFRDIDLELALSERAGPEESLGAVAKRDLERYYGILRSALSDVELTVEEASLVCDALNGVWLMERAESLPTILWAEVADGIRLNALDEKWKVEDGDALVARLRDLSPAAAIAVVDAVERWWRADFPEGTSREDSLREVGLVRS